MALPTLVFFFCFFLNSVLGRKEAKGIAIKTLESNASEVFLAPKRPAFNTCLGLDVIIVRLRGK
jgi:hypothetical protein